MKIENIGASGLIAESVDLERFLGKYRKLRSQQETVAWCSLPDPTISRPAFQRGRSVLAGLSASGAPAGGIAVARETKKAGTEPLKELRSAITDMVCSYNPGRFTNINRLSVMLNLENIQYEPGQFPGCSTGSKIPGSLSLSSSGKIILAGARTLEDIKEGPDSLEENPAGVTIGVSSLTLVAGPAPVQICARINV